MTKKKVVFVLVFAVAFLALTGGAEATYWIYGTVHDAADGTLADGHTVIVYLPGDEANNASDTIGPTGMSGTNNLYMCDAEAISGYTPTVGDEINVKVIDTGDGCTAEPVSVTISGVGMDEAPDMTLQAPRYGVELTPDTTAKTISTIETATYTLTVKNIGDVADTINLAQVGIGTLSKTSVDLAAGNDEDVTLEVTSTIVGDHVTTVTATSQGDASKTASVTVTTTVEEVRYGVKLSVDPTAKTVYTSKTATYTLTVENTGNKVDTINLTKDGIGTLSTGSVDLAADDSAEVTLEVSSSSTGTYETTVTATSQGNTSIFASKNVTTTVERRRVGGGGGGAPRDSDGDGYTDIQEMLAGTGKDDPCDPNPECAACLAITPAATPTPTAAPTAAPTAIPTAIPTAAPTAAPTATPEPPGFEAVFAIAGLLAVAYLVLRRKSK